MKIVAYVKRILFTILQCTWGILPTLVGLFFFLIFSPTTSKVSHAAIIIYYTTLRFSIPLVFMRKKKSQWLFFSVDGAPLRCDNRWNSGNYQKKRFAT